ncbi:MAG: histidine phosphatase family protein [Magnetococcales bacterium]|nr:histidine phosphatase family protein [Magnetococcales bacterium]
MSPKPSVGATTLDLLRHGQPEGGDRYRGSVDDPLSPLGWEQMRRAAAGGRWDAIVTSPLRRCADFAQELGERQGIPVALEPGVRELSFGLWEGLTGEEIMKSDGARLTAFWRNPVEHSPPEGESIRSVEARAMAAWEEILARHRGGRVLLVSHGGVIRVLLSRVMMTPLEHLSRWTVPYACLSRVRVDRIPEGDLPRLLFHGGRAEESEG